MHIKENIYVSLMVEGSSRQSWLVGFMGGEGVVAILLLSYVGPNHSDLFLGDINSTKFQIPESACPSASTTPLSVSLFQNRQNN